MLLSGLFNRRVYINTIFSDLIRKSNLFIQFLSIFSHMQCCSYFWTKQSIKNKPWRQTDIKTTSDNYVFLIFIRTHSRLCMSPYQTVSPRLTEHSKTLTFARHLRASVGTLPVPLLPPNSYIAHVNLMRQPDGDVCSYMERQHSCCIYKMKTSCCLNVLPLHPSEGFFLLVKSDR